MKKFIFALTTPLLLFAATIKSHAQNYHTAAGIKFGGYEIGPSIKWFADEHNALEGIAGFRSGGFAITGLYEMHTQAFAVNGLNFYYGGGGHLGNLRPGSYNGGRNVYSGNHVLVGLDGVVGLEYLLPDSPIIIGVDLNPRIEFAQSPVFDLAPALGIRYAF